MRSKKLLIVSLTLLFSIIVIGVPASIALAQSSGKAQVNNKAPTIVSVAISPDADLGRPGVQINPTASGTTAVSVNAQVRDDNGHNDITTVSVAVYKPDGTTIHVPPGNATRSSGNGANSTWTYTFNMNSYDPPATGDTAYKVVVTASDVPGSSATNSASPALFNYNELLALCLNTTIVDFGILDPGQTSGAESVVGSNVGNLTLDVALSGTSLTYQTNAIAVSQIDYSLSSTFTSPRALSSSSQTVSNYDLIAGATSSKPIYFRLRVPTADQQYLPAGTYQGTISILATQSM